MRFIKDDGGRTAAGHKKEGAIAIATERPYQEIWDALKELMEAEGGATKRSGVEEFVMHKLMTSVGWTWIGWGKLRLRADDLPSGRLVVSIHRHCVAVIDGVLHDTGDCSVTEWGDAPKVFGYYKKGVRVEERVIGAERKKLLDVIAKLLANGGSTEAEAASAKAKAAELIAKYDIDLASAKDLEKCEAVEEFRMGDIPSYEFTLLGAFGKFCGVLALSSPRQNSGRNYLFFGKQQDLEAFRLYTRNRVGAARPRMDGLPFVAPRMRPPTSELEKRFLQWRP